MLQIVEARLAKSIDLLWATPQLRKIRIHQGISARLGSYCSASGSRYISNGYVRRTICLTGHTRTNNSEVVRDAQPWYNEILTQDSEVLQALPATATL